MLGTSALLSMLQMSTRDGFAYRTAAGIPIRSTCNVISKSEHFLSSLATVAFGQQTRGEVKMSLGVHDAKNGST